MFQKRNVYVDHLTKVQPEAKASLTLPMKITRRRVSLLATTNRQSSQCRFPKCASNHSFYIRDSCVQHLRIIHKVMAKDRGPYMANAGTERTHDFILGRSVHVWRDSPATGIQCCRFWLLEEDASRLSLYHELLNLGLEDGSLASSSSNPEPVTLNVNRVVVNYSGCYIP